MHLKVVGTLFSGMGKGRYYVGHPEYQRRFEKVLGYVPYPGTLNIKLSDRAVIEEVSSIRKGGGVKVDGFSIGGESFSSLNCYDGDLRGERVTLLFIDVTYYNESVAELISPVYLRGKFGLKDGEVVEFTLNAT